MALPDQILVSDLLNHTVRCDLGLDHGPGVMAWIHPPAHRLLGWVSRPSALRMTREVWRLNQCCGLTDQQVYVRGEPAVTDQATLDRLPILLDADLVDRHGDRLGTLVDLVFEPATGGILHYLVARSDPRLPGGSRWRLMPDRIADQQSGRVFSNLNSLDDLPLERGSVRQDLLQRTQRWREQLKTMGDRAGGRLEGWFEERPWDDSESLRDASAGRGAGPQEEVWDDEQWQAKPEDRRTHQDSDPWV